jgi:hypothetical protein
MVYLFRVPNGLAGKYCYIKRALFRVDFVDEILI